MSVPQRIQLRRTKGWRKPAGAVVVARPSRWGNPYRVVSSAEALDGPAGGYVVGDRATAVDRFAAALAAGELGYTVDDVRRELAGRDLACWCPLGGPCHGDVLLAAASGVVS